MLYLRNGKSARNTLVIKYQNPEDVYRKNSREEFRKKYPDVNSAREAQKQGWKTLSEEEKDKYARLYDESVKQYEDNLVLLNGGTQEDIATAQEIKTIPPMPKAPLNALLRYLNEKKVDFIKANPNLAYNKACKELALQYDQLPDLQKRPYEMEFRNENDDWAKKMEEWERLYGDRFREGQQVLKKQHKYQSNGRQKEFQYQEILTAKQRRKLVPLRDDETNQVRDRGRQENEKTKEDSIDRKSQFRGRHINSPSQIPRLPLDEND